MDSQVSIARGHPRSATESYKRTLERSEFNEEEYHMGLYLPNVDFVSRSVEELISVLRGEVHGATTGEKINVAKAEGMDIGKSLKL